MAVLEELIANSASIVASWEPPHALYTSLMTSGGKASPSSSSTAARSLCGGGSCEVFRLFVSSFRRNPGTTDTLDVVGVFEAPLPRLLDPLLELDPSSSSLSDGASRMLNAWACRERCRRDIESILLRRIFLINFKFFGLEFFCFHHACTRAITAIQLPIALQTLQ